MQKQQIAHSSQVQMEHSPVDITLGHNTSLNKFEKIESMERIFSDYSGMKLGRKAQGKV